MKMNPRKKFSRITKRVLANTKKETLGRWLLYSSSGMLREKRLSGLVYFVEKAQLGKEFGYIIRKPESFAKLKKIASYKEITQSFLKCLKEAGGQRFSEFLSRIEAGEISLALRYGNGKNLGEALRLEPGRVTRVVEGTGGMIFGKAVNTLGGYAMVQAIRHEGSAKIIDGLTSKYDETMKKMHHFKTAHKD